MVKVLLPVIRPDKIKIVISSLLSQAKYFDYLFLFDQCHISLLKCGDVRMLLDILKFYGVKVIYYRLDPLGALGCKVFAFEESLRFEEGYSFSIEDDIFLEPSVIKLLKEVLDKNKRINSVSPVALIVNNDLSEVPNLVTPDGFMRNEDGKIIGEVDEVAYKYSEKDEIVERDYNGKPVIMVRDSIVRKRIDLVKKTFLGKDWVIGIDVLFGKIFSPFCFRTGARIWDFSEKWGYEVIKAAEMWAEWVRGEKYDI
jgi:hypothetical protein